MKLSTGLVSVIIKTHNRLNYLLTTLHNLKKQNYKNLEIFVVDNGSKEKISQAHLNKFQNVQLINLNKNYGIDAFNKVIHLVKGTYILILDDDSYPENETIDKAIKYLEKDKSSGAVAFNIYNSKFDFFETKDYKKGYVHLFVGCGVIFRSEVIRKVGFYDKLFFVYVNEIDLSIRIINNGYNIYYLEDAVIVHMSAGDGLDSEISSPYRSKFRFYHITIGHLIYLTKHFSMQWVVIYSLKWLLNRIIVAIQFKLIKTFFKALFQFAKMFHNVVSRRKVVKKEIQKIYNYGKIPLFDRDYYPDFEKKKIMNNVIKIFRVHY